jgi:hypothetical protein
MILIGNILLTALPFVCAAEEVSSSLKSRLFAEGVEGWKQFEDRAHHVRCVIDATRSVYNKKAELPEKPRQTRWELDFNGNSFLFKAQALGSLATSVWSRNSRYGFSIGRMSDNDVWLLDYRGSSNAHELDHYDGAFGASVRSPYSLFDVPLMAIVKDASFQLRRLSSRMADGVELVDMEFSLDSVNKNIRDIEQVKMGRVVFEPRLQWAVREYDVELAEKNASANLPATHTVASIEYSRTDSKVPVISESTYKLIRPNYTIVWTDRIKEIKSSTSPEEVFMLSAFGLPEPPEPGDERMEDIKDSVASWRFWALVAGTLFAALAFIARRVRS